MVLIDKARTRVYSTPPALSLDILVETAVATRSENRKTVTVPALVAWLPERNDLVGLLGRIIYVCVYFITATQVLIYLV